MFARFNDGLVDTGWTLQISWDEKYHLDNLEFFHSPTVLISYIISYISTNIFLVPHKVEKGPINSCSLVSASVCPCVTHFLRIGSKNLSNFWHEVRGA